jgi:hypothetical protein
VKSQDSHVVVAVAITEDDDDDSGIMILSVFVLVCFSLDVLHILSSKKQTQVVWILSCSNYLLDLILSVFLHFRCSRSQVL